MKHSLFFILAACMLSLAGRATAESIFSCASLPESSTGSFLTAGNLTASAAYDLPLIRSKINPGFLRRLFKRKIHPYRPFRRHWWQYVLLGLAVLCGIACIIIIAGMSRVRR